jgi:alpha-beta hydrolase superfamily lysophospholipase
VAVLSIKTVAGPIRAAKRLKTGFGRITFPLFVLNGTEDKATRPSGSEFFHAHAGSTDKTLKLCEGHFHDLLADVGKEGVIADIVAWITQRLPAR